MEIIDVPTDLLREAPWNPNEADDATLRRLAMSIGRFGTVLPLVVRPLDGAYEVLGGNQRLKVYRERGVAAIPCVEVQADDAHSRLLAQALNAVHGEDDLSRKAALVRDLLAAMNAEQVAAILPDTVEALRGLAGLGQSKAGDLAQHLTAWAAAEAIQAQVKLHVTSFPFSDAQKKIVEEAVARAMPRVAGTDAPNRRALALVEVCTDWLHGRGFSEDRPAPRPRSPRAVSAAVTPQPEEEVSHD